MPAEPLILDSITHLKPEHRGRPVLSGSHGGRYAAWYAAEMGAGAAIFNDAGIGRDRAGVSGLALLAKLSIPAACVSHRSARIGQGQHALEHGVLSEVNAPAAALGLTAGMTAREAMARLAAADLAVPPKPPAEHEARRDVPELGRDGVRVIVMDSISLVSAADVGHIAVTASHGGLLGGRPETAVKYPVFAVVTNDADRGCDDAGITRLPALDAQNIAGACVAASSARIGDGASTLDDGIISVVNETARRHGGAVGQTCRAFVAAMVAARAGAISAETIVMIDANISNL